MRTLRHFVTYFVANFDIFRSIGLRWKFVLSAKNIRLLLFLNIYREMFIGSGDESTKIQTNHSIARTWIRFDFKVNGIGTSMRAGAIH